MQILVDTNVLLRATDHGHSHQEIAAIALHTCQGAGHQLVIVPQVVYEFWVVATRPVDQNGMGLSVEDADRQTSELIQLFALLRDERRVFDHWLELVRLYRVQGKPAHDARLAAAMARHGLQGLLTFNVSDF